jgi:predicted O-methyltransferase YrrM
MERRWSEVDTYFGEALGASDADLESALRRADNAGLPAISVSPLQGKLLHLLALTVGAQRILEIGTLGGYSAIWLARALPPTGRLTTLEIDPHHAEVAEAAIAEAGLSDRVEVKVGRALDVLPSLSGPFDLVFIDADKPSNPDYFHWALELTRPGGLIIIDNVVRGGAVVDARRDDSAVLGVRRLTELVAREPRVSATALQTVGLKGWDGLLLARVVSES